MKTLFALCTLFLGLSAHAQVASRPVIIEDHFNTTAGTCAEPPIQILNFENNFAEYAAINMQARAAEVCGSKPLSVTELKFSRTCTTERLDGAQSFARFRFVATARASCVIVAF